MSRTKLALLIVGATLIAIAAIFILFSRCDGPSSTPVPTLTPVPTATATATATPTLTPVPTATATATPPPIPAPAQGFPVPDKEDLESPELGTALDDLVSRIESGEVTEEEAASEAPVSRGKTVAVTIHLASNVDGVVRFLEDNNVTPRHIGEDYVEAFVPVRLLREISEMTGVLYVETIIPAQGSQAPPKQQIQGDGPEAHGSAAWNEAGFTGKGIKIGIIDAGFEGISQLLGTELPETVKARCYGTETDDPGGLENCGGGNHGTLVAESIIDIAPEASLYLAAAWSKGDLADIVDWMISEGVSVINMSLGWTFDGPGDGTSTSTGSPLNTLTRAVNEGIVWINSAGNEADSAWFGAPGDSDGDGVLEFGDFGEQLNLYTGGFNPVQLRWDGSWGGQTVDIDLYIYDEGGRVVRRSLDPQKGGAGHNPYERVVLLSGGNTILQVANRSDNMPRWMQIVVWNGDIGESSRNGSIGSPGESSNPGMLTVGAAHWERTETIEMYSSRGPAPDGRIKPDVVGAACGETALLGPDGAFCGTSQASPHVAGMAALVRQMFPDFTPQQVVEYLVENAQERGSPGLDNTWGAGFSTLPTPSTPTPTPTSTPVATPTPTPVPTATPIPTPTPVPTATPIPTPVPNRDRHALEALYRATDGDNWEENGNWLSDAPLDEWYGVSIDDAGRVIGIDLRGNKLNGELPEDLRYLPELEVFELWGNSIFGTIPSSLGVLSRLTVLDLGQNVLEGEIPEPLGNLDRLQNLYLSGDFHDLIGCIPVGLSDVPNNDFNLLGLPFCGPVAQEGESPDRSALEAFYHATDGPNWTDNTNWLSDKPFGEWHGVTTDNSGNVTGLVLNSNQLSGQLPSELGSLSSLTGLWLGDNQLTGDIPQELGSLSNLTGLSLGNNQLSGEIPAELGNLPNLDILWLNDNQLSGSIPTELGSLSKLTDLWLSANQLSGEIPPELASLSDLIELDLAYNRLSGEIPPELGSLSKLKDLWLSANRLSGSIPPELASLANLQSLQINGNQLTSEIPQELGNLSNLTYLHLAFNELSGEIPPELGGLSNLQGLFIDGNQLTGSLPLNLTGLQGLSEFWFIDNAGLCAPRDASFQTWLGSIPDVSGPTCADPDDTSSAPTPTDRDILEIFYNATDGPNWTDKTNWLSGKPFVEWHGVETDGSGNVTGLFLYSNQLSGQLPSELGGLSNLTGLSLGENQLSGEIPAELGGLSNLTWLDLADNQLSGEIPQELGGLSNLTWLSLRENQLSGGIPPELGGLSNLGSLSLGGNQLSGEIPAELVGLSNLTSLILGGNQLSGEIPPELGSLSNLTTWLSLGENQLSGEIPAELGGLSNLTGLSLYGNQLTGGIPAELGGLSNLTRLYLSGNQLSGEIPPELGSLSNLTSLILEDNQLSGEIPPELGGLSNLQDLGLVVNQLSGSLPLSLTGLTEISQFYFDSNAGLCAPTDAAFQQWLQAIPNRDAGPNCEDASPDRSALEAFYRATDGPNWTINVRWLSDRPVGEWYGVTTDDEGRVTRLELGGNDLAGTIPSELGDLSNLTHLNLAFNELSGEIPAELGNLSNLTGLWLYGNQLSGEIPPELGSLSNLTELTLAQNQLSGEIPSDLGGLSNLTRLDLDFNELSGEIPTELGGLSNLTGLGLGHNQLSGEIPPELGNLSNLTGLGLDGNQLRGSLPLNLTGLKGLSYFWFIDNAGLCAPRDASFQTWLESISNAGGPNCADPDDTSSEPTPTDRDILEIFYHATDGDNWTNNTNWLSDMPLDEWHGVTTDGVTTDDEGRVTELLLPNNQLRGSIPSELGRLASLTELNLFGNQLSWFIPPELGNLSNLTVLFLGRNQLIGAIPPELGSLANLTGLYLGGNVLSGAIPPELGSLSNLTGLGLGGNQLSGAIPSELGNLSNLRDLYLFSNQLSGAIPPEFGGLSNLRDVTLKGNQLTGPLPLSLTGLTRLDLRFHFGGNAGLCAPTDAAFQQWLQAIPDRDDGPNCEDAPTTSTLTDREILEILYNATDGDNWNNNTNWLSDIPIGEWHGVTTDEEGRVTRLGLEHNQLSGSIPPELGGLSSLTWLSLWDNQLSGSIPPELGNLSGLAVLHLRANQLSGEIPAELGGLSNLSTLNLPGNQLSGAIPAELGRLSNLTYLHLYDNELSGEIPAELGGLSNLSNLNLRGNQLSGAIPPELGGLSKLRWLWLNGNTLTGCIPPALRNVNNNDLNSLNLQDCAPP